MPQWTLFDQHLGAEDEREAEQHEEHLRPEVDHREPDRELRRLGDPDDVERHEQDDHDRAADDVPRVLAERLPEDREVVGHEERGGRDRDDVDEHLRPRRAERDELVEAVPREARRAARLGEAHRPLRVRRRRGREHDARDDEDERRQPERDRRPSARARSRSTSRRCRRRWRRARACRAPAPCAPRAADGSLARARVYARARVDRESIPLPMSDRTQARGDGADEVRRAPSVTTARAPRAPPAAAGG